MPDTSRGLSREMEHCFGTPAMSPRYGAHHILYSYFLDDCLAPALNLDFGSRLVAKNKSDYLLSLKHDLLFAGQVGF